MSLVLLGGVLADPGAFGAVDRDDAQDRGEAGSENPILFYKHFLESTVLTHLQALRAPHGVGETAVGIGLTLGLLNGLASVVGLSW